MPLYVVTFIEDGGYRVTCRMRADTDEEHIACAVQKIWGAQAYWEACPGSQTTGRVFDRDYAREPEDVYRTGLMTVTVERATRRVSL